ncbi:MAG: CoA transferase [Chloroflexi bacterium]|nr:CoA transferase [Chloroflexota bacterium]
MPAALEGIRVLDLTRTLAGPFCTQLLGDNGADVVKVEEPELGDETRSWSPTWHTQSVFFLSFNRNKRSLTLNLKDARAREIALKLATQADVFIESFRAGTADKMGLGYEALSKLNPGIVYCSISGYGRTGPFADKPGYDLIIQGYGGLMSLTGAPDGPPMRIGYSMVDLTAGLVAYGGITTALVARARTGEGQYLESSLLEGQVAAMSYHALGYWATGRVPQRMGDQHPSIAPYQMFRAADGHMIVGVANDGLWRRFCDKLGLDDLVDDPKYRTNNDRVRNRTELIEKLQAMFLTQPKSHWLPLIEAAGVPCGPINNIDQVLADPQVLARDMIVEIEHPEVPNFKTYGTPMKLWGTPGSIRRPPPLLGQHTDEVLGEMGYSAADVAALRADKVV